MSCGCSHVQGSLLLWSASKAPAVPSLSTIKSHKIDALAVNKNQSLKNRAEKNCSPADVYSTCVDDYLLDSGISFHQLLLALFLPPKVQHKLDVISKIITSVWTETDGVIQLQPQKFHIWCAELLDCGAWAHHCPHSAVSKGWTHLYLLKELTQFKTDTEMEFS